MRIKRILFGLAVILAVAPGLDAQGIPSEYMNNSHDIQSLSPWGPYSKQYAGISYVEDMTCGERVDFTVAPGMYRRSYSIPNVLYESGWHPWRASADMRSITYRFELEWKDKVYVDVTYNVADDSKVSVLVDCVNNSDVVQNILLHNLVSMHYDDDHPLVRAEGMENLAVLYGCDYSDFEPSVRRHDHGLVYNGWMRGEERDGRSLSGSVLGGFGENAGDRVDYEFNIPGGLEDGKLALRYMVEKGRTAEIEVSGCIRGRMGLSGTGGYELAYLDAASFDDGPNVLTITSLNGEKVRIDAVALGRDEDVDGMKVVQAPLKYRPELEKGDKDFVADFPSLRKSYAVAWNYEHGEIKEFENSDLDVFMRRTVHRHPPKYFGGDRKGHFTSAFLRPIVLRPHSDTTIAVMFAAGEKAEVRRLIADFHADPSVPVRKEESDGKYLPQAEDFAFGTRLLQATLLTNVVYPVYTQKEFIRHFTPGKNWNSLYTWDLGCISLALNEIDEFKAFETIKAYTTESGAQSAFIHHGTPLPIQFFAFSELDSRLPDDEAMTWLYTRLKQYYDYMTGRDGRSATLMPSGLIRTWDYFYNSGGWDDYPPQHQLRTDKHLYPSVVPVVSSAYYLRAAKILRMYAEKTGNRKDVRLYDKDVKALSAAVQNNAWDEESGYYGYVMHDPEGRACGIYLDEDGSNFNMGLDGVSPLVGGCCDEIQAQRLISNIFSPERLWTDVGISTVDKSAGYYDMTGYWNGSVWIPHQYFIWKSLLDNGRPDLAEKLAMTVLKTWEKECRESYNCCEHFIIASGRGAGWHNFSGLSSPVINFYNNYFRIGHIATGFDTSVDSYLFADDDSSLKAVLRFDRSSLGKEKSVIVCMNPEHEYKVTFNGRNVPVTSPYKGLLYINLCPESSTGDLNISPLK